MNVNLNETVTIKLETYEQMKLEIEILKKQVEQKTIVKEIPFLSFHTALTITMAFGIIYMMYRIAELNSM